MTIESIVQKRGITRILHFTTNKGLLGILASGAAKSRARLPREQYLEYVYKPNCSIRKNVDWLDYVNLSIQRINSYFFEICAKKWHSGDDIWWYILSFSPAIITHPGVWFATTNNMYSGVRRDIGPAGLEALYGPTILWYESRCVYRDKSKKPAEPTCAQAEVLYPGELSIEYLTTVYAAEEEHYDLVYGQMSALGIDTNKVPILIDRSIFS